MTLPSKALRLSAAAVLSVGASLGLFATSLPSTAEAATPSCPTLNGTQLTSTGTVTPSDGGHAYVVCTGKVRTFDGTPLHIDVSIPSVGYTPPGATTPQAKHPLMMFLSGWSNDICQFESTTWSGTAVAGCSDFIGNAGYHWNNAYFASQGWVTLNYTPRGWYESCGKNPRTGYSYATDPTCNDTPGEESWVHLYDRRYEIRDAQFLAGLLADNANVNPNQIVSTGDSGGGGPSWDLALSQDRVVTLNSTPSSVHTIAWRSPKGTALHLLAAVPMYTWTDLVDALTSNGRASDGFHGAPANGNRESPVGVEKQSYVTGLFALGLSDIPSNADRGAQYSAPGQDPTADLSKWFADINAGEPSFSVNPDTPTILAQVGGALRSPYRVPVPSTDRKPIFSIQGLTDPLFNGLQTSTMVNRLLSISSTYPVWAFYGDVGHSYANNPLDVWQRAHNASNAWLNSIIAGKTPAQPRVTVETTRCVSGQTLQQFTATTFASIASRVINFSSAAAQTTTNSNAVIPEGAQSDPIANSGCRTMAASQSDPNQASYTFPVSSAVTLAGSPIVRVKAAVTGSSAEIAARLWDVDASGNQTLVSRTVYRIDAGTSGGGTFNLAFELPPNAWQLAAGHSIKLELTQDDAPTWRADNEPSSITLSNLALALPVR